MLLLEKLTITNYLTHDIVMWYCTLWY